jgi:hypothetical protein
MSPKYLTRSVALALASAAGASGLVGCASSKEQQVLPPVVLGMTETTPPAFDDGQTKIYQVTEEVRLPLREPLSGERPEGKVDPYPRAPFHVVRDTRITVRWTLSNLEDKQNIVELLFDPWNEFVRYSPGVNAGGEEALPNFSGNQRFVILPPLGRVEGILTPDDVLELATDLATCMALDKQKPPAGSAPDPNNPASGPALFNRAMNTENRSTVTFDPVLAKYIPPVVAGLTGFDVGLRSAGPVRVAVELVIDVEDLQGNRVVPSGAGLDTVAPPRTRLVPPAPQAMP